MSIGSINTSAPIGQRNEEIDRNTSASENKPIHATSEPNVAKEFNSYIISHLMKEVWKAEGKEYGEQISHDLLINEYSKVLSNKMDLVETHLNKSLYKASATPPDSQSKVLDERT